MPKVTLTGSSKRAKRGRIPAVGWLAMSGLLLASAGGALAQDAPPPAAPAIIGGVSDHPVTFADLPAPKRFVTRHKTVIRGKSVSYTATAGETYITNIAGEPIASFFCFSYVRDDVPGRNRPVIFVFNGGPGSASLWLHMGALGPRRLVFDREVNPSVTPPFTVEDNADSPLDAADLVFIDPVGTGFSHAVGNAKDSDFFGTDVDADSVARFIERWMTENGRWNSPRYLVGESYGTVRAAILPRALTGGISYGGTMRGIGVNGVILVSVGSNLAMRSVLPPGPPAPNPMDGQSIASMAITAWYHGKIDRAGRTARDVYDEAAKFGTTEYAQALFKLKNGTLSDPEKAQVANRLAQLTGLSAQTWLDANLRIDIFTFLKRVLADKGLQAGVYDSRYTLPLEHSGEDFVADDPAMGQYVPGFISTFNQMLRDELKVEMPQPYKAIVWEGLYDKWDSNRIGPAKGKPSTVDLSIAMRRNPGLRVMAASGEYDMLATPLNARYQLELDGLLPQDRVTYRTYESGHMLYLGHTAAQFSDDVRNFVSAAPGPAR